MSKERPKNLAASVHQRIINLARAQNSDANLIFTRYGLERFLYRLSRSRHADSSFRPFSAKCGCKSKSISVLVTP